MIKEIQLIQIIDFEESLCYKPMVEDCQTINKIPRGLVLATIAKHSGILIDIPACARSNDIELAYMN